MTKRKIAKESILILSVFLFSGFLFCAGYLYRLNGQLSGAISLGDDEKAVLLISKLDKFQKSSERFRLNYVMDKIIRNSTLENEGAFFYKKGDCDEVIKRLANEDGATSAFVRGNCLFKKAVIADPKEDTEKLLDESKKNYLAAISQDPKHFDSKFNYEIMASDDLRKKILEKQKQKAEKQKKEKNKDQKENKDGDKKDQKQDSKSEPGGKPYLMKDLLDKGGPSHGNADKGKRG